MTGAGTTVDEARYLPFLEGPRTLDQESFRWRLGVRELDLRDWIELGPDADAAIAAKPRLNAEHRSTVFAALDGVEDESQQVADTLLDHLRRRWPDRYADAVLDPTLHPLDAAARLVPEDLVLMVERDGRLVFGAGSVCFPNRWDLRSKIGLPLADVHAPVALLNEQLQGPIDRFFERLTPERSFWRLGLGRARHRRLVHADRRNGGSSTERPRPRRLVPARRARDAASLRGVERRAVHDPHLCDADPIGRRRTRHAAAPRRRPRRASRPGPGVQGRRVVRACPDRPSPVATSS